jgi:hypothetical protein
MKMISTASNFEASVGTLVDAVNIKVNEDIYYQKDIMVSNTHNSSMHKIETMLDTLYEHTRMLQDIIDYAKEYVSTNIYDVTAQCKQLYNELISDVDTLKAKGYISYSIPFIEGPGDYTDRDGLSLSHCAINMGSVTLSGNVVNTLKYDTITRESNYVSYKNNIDDLRTGGAYRSSYTFDNVPPPTDGITEKITVGFTTPVVMNYIDYITSRCDVVQIEYIYDSGTVEVVTDVIGTKLKDRKVKSIILYIKATAYDTENYQVTEVVWDYHDTSTDPVTPPATQTDNNYWTVETYNHGSLTNQTTITDLNELNILLTVDQLYHNYQQQLLAANANS